MKDLRLHVRSIFALKVVRAIFYNQKSRCIIFFYILTGRKTQVGKKLPKRCTDCFAGHSTLAGRHR